MIMVICTVSSCAEQPHVQIPTPAPSHSCKLPVNTRSAGPVMYTWLSASLHSMCNCPPGKSTLQAASCTVRTQGQAICCFKNANISSEAFIPTWLLPQDFGLPDAL